MKQVKKLFACTFVFLILTVLGTMNIFAEEIGIGIVTGSCVNIRQQPSTSSAILGQLYRGAQVKVYEVSGEWLRIGYNGGNNQGWMYGAYVSVKKYDTTSRSGDQIGRNYSIPLNVQIVNFAEKFLGVKYVYGGSSPNGFDCSGFTSYVYKQFGYNLNRVASDQTAHGVPVDKANLIAGDLVFFRSPSSSHISHVGIYVSDGIFIHASSGGGKVQYNSLNSGYHAQNFVTARRIIQ